MKLFYRFLLTLNSLVLLLIVYFVKEYKWIPKLGVYSVIIFVLIPILLSAICLWIANFLSRDTIEGGITDVEMVNNSYLPSYLGYFFIALSVQRDKYIALILVFGIVFVFTYCSQSLYYNPMFLVFGYKFYYVTKSNGLKVFIISKKEIKTTKELQFPNLRRINDFTFIDKEHK